MADNTFTGRVTESNESIKNEIKDNIKSSLQAINEYVWNSIDAEADEIEINLEHHGKTPVKLTIKDNGVGINYEKLKTELFAHLHDSPKKKLKKDYLSLPYGKDGYGRFSFIKFANKAIWKSVYTQSNRFMEFETFIHSSNLIDFRGVTASNSLEKKTGTTVTISDFNPKQDLIVHETKSLEKIKNSLLKEFYWIIAFKDIKIKFNGENINIDDICEKYQSSIIIRDKKFEVNLFRWKDNACKISNRHFLNSDKKEIYVTRTAFSNIDDQFLHSVVVQGEMFNDFSPISERKRQETSETPLISKDEFEIFNDLKEQVNLFSDNIRRQFSENFVKRKIENFENKHYFDKLTLSKTEKIYKKPHIIAITKEVLRFAPKVFSNLNEEQTLVFLNVINKLLDDDSNTLLDILKVLVRPENEGYLNELKTLLDKYPLGNIVSTIRLIDERIKALDKIRKRVYNLDKYSIESDLQQEIKKNFWIFGDEYTNLIGEGNGEDTFDKLYKEYRQLNNLEMEDSQTKISQKQVDLFVYGKIDDGKIEKHLIVEIKRPRYQENSKTFMKLGLKEYGQLEEYSEIIRKIPLLNSPNTKEWNYYLVGADLDDSFSYQERNICLMRYKPEHNIKLYSISWTELLDRARFRLNYVRNILEKRKKETLSKMKPSIKS